MPTNTSSFAATPAESGGESSDMKPRKRTGLPGWIDTTRDLTSTICNRLRCDRVLVGIIVPQRPRCDELIVCTGFSPGGVQVWLESGFRSDSVLRHALRTGAAAGTAGESQWVGPEIPAEIPVACFSLPEGFPDRRHWLVTASRPSGPFTDIDLHALSLIARQWIAQFNRPREEGLCRLLVGNNDRILHADPAGEAWLSAAQVDIKPLMSELRDVVQQRWPKFADDELHDAVFNLAGRCVWIRFERRRALPVDAAEQWYLELRPVEEGDLTPVGVIEDERIARAVGYIDDHYNDSPGLNIVADLVEISAFHFHRLFSKLVGTTPKQYVLQKQIHMAKWMLRTRRMPISAIASQTGFASHGHFTSTFRRMQNLSPTEYREKSED